MNFQLKELMVVGFSIILKIKKIVIFMYVEQVAEGMWIMLAFWSVRRIDFLTKNVGENMWRSKIMECTMALNYC